MLPAVQTARPRLSFVIPVLEEASSLEALTEKIRATVERDQLGAFEIWFVDDGSRDRSWAVIERLHAAHPDCVFGLRFRRNFGKASALAAGFAVARGEIIFTMDADLQDDPEEIPRFLQELERGHDLVSGWKQERKDPWEKRIPSWIFNAMVRGASDLKLHDFNCGFKAYRREVCQHLNLYGELHRFIPLLAAAEGFRVGEIPVRHHAREHGASKYNWKRYIRGLLDLFTVITLTRYMQRPGHLFGGLGLLVGVFGLGILAYLSAGWFMGYKGIAGRPLFYFGILGTLLSAQLISLGLLAELVLRHTRSDNSRRHVAQRCGTGEK